ncbi:hypothetical protein SNOG_14523 [Parastagonospora nodorum SN15]|uniref:Uncharacterized protein n=1 Tax=Phaeosphaeria nodorum (strain SN15 / ATCC MYA-4574 / FGSC 10173) TaxID=321614 RepID=Q0U108_PHANO|nr:hypothetical protein SNOG_14523 [Parastagonospora nodorum SN15]EAT78063.1 hypothetical protein SNOG_14523 [Parastagonospora nodorum SN15]
MSKDGSAQLPVSAPRKDLRSFSKKQYRATSNEVRKRTD